jgi:hypothetical protein
MHITLATYGRELPSRESGGFTLAPDAVPKLVLIGALLLILALWIRAYLQSPGR